MRCLRILVILPQENAIHALQVLCWYTTSGTLTRLGCHLRKHPLKLLMYIAFDLL